MLILLTDVGTQQMTHFLEIEYLHLVVSDCVCIALSFKGGCQWLLGTAGQKMVMCPYSPFTCFMPWNSIQAFMSNNMLPSKTKWKKVCKLLPQTKGIYFWCNSFIYLTPSWIYFCLEYISLPFSPSINNTNCQDTVQKNGTQLSPGTTENKRKTLYHNIVCHFHV